MARGGGAHSRCSLTLGDGHLRRFCAKGKRRRDNCDLEEPSKEERSMAKAAATGSNRLGRTCRRGTTRQRREVPHVADWRSSERKYCEI
uniref:Uncharacterized protein n=1 Tax=Hyaloperonospora arabidopsidis (strain Emoy2) TaxID=559515 RepID=M4BHL5_HYAAE